MKVKDRNYQGKPPATFYSIFKVFDLLFCRIVVESNKPPIFYVSAMRPTCEIPMVKYGNPCKLFEIVSKTME